jgi:hypoxanthine phosphoribosyltransferase
MKKQCIIFYCKLAENCNTVESITVKDKKFTISIPNSSIINAVSGIAEQINHDYKGKNPLFIVVLNGAFIFAADLLKKINLNCELSFVKLASYSGTQSTNKVKEIIGLVEDVKGRDVIIVEDIIDTGITMQTIISELKIKEPASVRIATLLFKPDAFEKNFKIDYICMNIPNRFIVGYGLDYDGYGRNLPDIYTIVE